MPEQQNSTALVPVDGEYLIEVKEFNSAGAANKFMVPVPKDVSAQGASIMLRAAILKRTTWKNFDFPTILHAVLYADRMGLDIIAGDVYMAEEGRMSTTAGAKIRHAMSSNRIVGYDVEMTDGPPITIPWETSKSKGQYEGPNLKCKVTVHVKDWVKPVVYETTLAEWFAGRNPNWRTRPAYMLRRNALGKALEEVAPMGIEPDEAPPVTTVATPEPETKTALAAAIQSATTKGEQQ